MDKQTLLILTILLVMTALLTLLGIRIRNWLSKKIGIESELYTFDRLVSWLLLLAIMSGVAAIFGNNLVVNYKQEFAPIIPWVNLAVSIISAFIWSIVLGFKKWLKPLAIGIAVIFELIAASIISYSGLSIII